MRPHVVQATERALHAFQRTVALTTGFTPEAFGIEACEELARIAHLLDCNPELVAAERIELL